MSHDDTAVQLRVLDVENYADVLALEVKPEQRGYVATNAKSLAQAHFHDEAWYRGIYAGDVPVGFVMLEVQPDKAEYAVWRFMIAAEHQGKGYGRKAMQLVIDHVRTLPNATELLLSHISGEHEPGPFYESLGFAYTGELLEGERIMRLPLDAS